MGYLTKKNAILILMFSFEAMVIHASAQKRSPFYSREISLVSENDLYTFEDTYYTAGQDVYYRMLLRPESRLQRLLKSSSAKDSSKTIIQFHYGIKMFTPSNILEGDKENLDRPYAGWNFANVSVVNFPTSRGANQYQFELGLVGPASGMEQLQNWMHQFTRYTLAYGWDSQIRDEVVVNVGYKRLQQLKLLDDLDIVSESEVSIGTGSNFLSQTFTMRVIQFLDMDNSVFSNSRLSWDTRKQGRKRELEFFLFVGVGMMYVVSNIFIEGSLFASNPSTVTLPREPWVTRIKYGLMFSKHDISYSITIHHLSKEVIKGDTDNYASLALAVRF